MNYAIYAPPPVTTSAGISALYKLNDDLKRLGERSRVILANPYAVTGPDEIVIYPDTTRGNPLKSENIVRYLLMFPGYFGDDTDFPESEMMYYYSDSFILNGRNPENILHIPVIDENRFPYRPSNERFGTCYLSRKCQEIHGIRPNDLPAGCIKITDHTNLKTLFSFVRTLVTFDNSAINLEAALAGIEIDWRFNPSFESRISLGPDFEWSNPRPSYQRLKDRYYDEQLPQFIKRTQERFR